jgi:lipid II:glycine glycyltransferase (peptidoglycan interpeptide bridge formation enzyme)
MMQLITDPEKIDNKEWSDFVHNHPDGNIFQTPDMYEVYKKSKNYEPIFCAIVNESHKIIAILLAVVQKESDGFFGQLTARSIVFGGPLLRLNDKALLDYLLTGYLGIVRKRVIYTQFRNFNIQDILLQEIFERNNFIFENHLNILLDLKIGVDELWKGLKKSRKDGINKARKQGFTFKVVNKLDTIENFYKLFENLYSNIRIPYPHRSFFQNLNEKIHENLWWFILEYNGLQSIILCAFQYNKVLYAFSIGIYQDNDFLKMRPVDYFYWEVIKWGSENGLERFDWMGAGKPQEEYGVRKFKLEYGGELKDLGRYIRVHRPLLYKIGKTGIKIRQRIKL